MLTQDEVAKLFGTHITTVTTLRELGILKAIRIGRAFMFSQEGIRTFQKEYAGLDVSNKYKAIRSREYVEERHHQEQGV